MPKDADGCPYQPYPRIIETLKSLYLNNIACGKAHSIGIESTGCLYSWGAGACGQLGVEGNLILLNHLDLYTLPYKYNFYNIY